MINGRNNQTPEAFIDTITHPRKRQLAQMILDGSSVEEMNAAEFGRLNILEMVSLIKRNVVGREDFSLDIPRGTGRDSTSEADAEASEQAAAADAGKDTGASSTPTPTAPVAAPTATEAPEGSADAPAGGSVDQRAPDGGTVPGVTAGEPTAHPVETVGGNPVGTLTGQEDAETLQRKADEEAAARAGDAA